MSEEGNRALVLFFAGRRDEAIRVATTAAARNPGNAHAQYALGQCMRFSNRIPEACIALARADAIAPGDPPVLAALAIARQLNGEYTAAIDVLRRLLEADSNHVEGYNTLGMTQKLMGAFEEAAHNYDEGLKALTREIVDALQNAESSPREPHWQNCTNVWTEYTLFGALYLGVQSSMDSVAWPTGEVAERDAQTKEMRGWYWEDSKTAPGKSARLFLPNYFNTMSRRYRGDNRYATIVGNRSTVLRLMGRVEEAEQWAAEADEFMEADALVV
jgi:tetratricopeptide (TPR) repeat protein